MSTSANPMMARQDAKTQVVAHVSLKMAQMASMLAPPLFLVNAVVRRGKGMPLSVARILRNSTRAVVGGGVLGVAAGYGRLYDQPDVAIEDRAFRLAHNPTQVETDDFSIIGAALGAVVVPAIFLRRATTLNLIMGGASLGLGAGVWTHMVRMWTQGEDMRPEGMVGEIPVVGGNDKK